MIMPAVDHSRSGTAPKFVNSRCEVVQPVCFAIVYWDSADDTLYAFHDRSIFDRQRTSAERNFAQVFELSAEEAADWILAGGKAVLLQISAGGKDAPGDLKLAFG